MSCDDYFTLVRPDVIREIENRGKKSDAVGVQTGWGANADTMVLQKNRLKEIDTPGAYESLLNQIVPLRQKKRNKSPEKKGQYQSEFTTKWFLHSQKNDEPFIPKNTTLNEFIQSSIGKAIESYTLFLKNKL